MNMMCHMQSYLEGLHNPLYSYFDEWIIFIIFQNIKSIFPMMHVTMQLSRPLQWLRLDIHIVPDQILVRTKEFWSWNLVPNLLGPGAVYISTQNFGLLLQ